MSSLSIKKKIIILGDRGIGKSSIIFRYTEGIYESIPGTLGTSFTPKTIKLFGHDLTLMIYDTAGQETYKSIAKFYYRNTNAVILIYKQSDRSTFDNLNYWVNELKSNLAEDVPVYLVASQCDNETNCADEEELKIFCEENNLKASFKVSALTGFGIEELFKQIASNLMSGLNPGVPERSKSLKLDQIQKRKTICKC